jgi:hypothetical protein
MSRNRTLAPRKRRSSKKVYDKEAAIIDARLNQITDRNDFSSLIRNRYSRRPAFGYEFEMLSHIVRSTDDLFRVNLKVISRYQALDVIKFITVNFKRDDIQDPRNQISRSERAPLFYWDNSKPGLCYTRINWNAATPYSRSDWMALRQKAIYDAVEMGGDVIILGEFDYPPEEHPPELAQQADFANTMRAFDDDIKKTINGVGRNIILLAGSRHEENAERHAVTNTAY